MKERKMRWLVIYMMIISAIQAEEPSLTVDFPTGSDRIWPGIHLWANRPQDWRQSNGRLECHAGDKPLRNVHLLSADLGPKGALTTSVRFGKVEYSAELGKNDWVGFGLGVGAKDMDYRARSLIFHSAGANAGIIAALDGDGWLVFLDGDKQMRPLPTFWEGDYHLLRRQHDLQLRLNIIPEKENTSQLHAILTDNKTGKVLQEARSYGIKSERLAGNIALTSHYGLGKTGKSYWFGKWTLSGERLQLHPERQKSPIIGALYMTSQQQLTLTAQLHPVGETDGKTVRLKIKKNQKWQEIGKAAICEPGWYATIRVPNWLEKEDCSFRLVYTIDGSDHYFHGRIKAEPSQREFLMIAAFTGNNNMSGSFDQTKRSKKYDFIEANLWFPHNDIMAAVPQNQPDLLVYTGDQIYEHRPVKADHSGALSSYVDYVYKWSLFYWAHNPLLSQYPTVCLIDDHDIWQINLWGKGGAASKNLPKEEIPEQYGQWMKFMYRHDQGYILPGDWINMAEGSQMDHLPAFETEPVKQGIKPRYGRLEYAGISFALIEDRKYKSSPLDFVPESKPFGGRPTVKDFDPDVANQPDAILYGAKQLAFIEDWATDWRFGAQMKIALSQTILASLQTGVGVLNEYPKEGPRMDFDSAGWPQAGRLKALEALRKGFAFVIAGDQHLGSIVHHGVEDWGDAGWSFCVPAIGNQAPRRWSPMEAAFSGHKEGMPRYTGNYLDAFNNKVTVWAVSNPWNVHVEPGSLHDRATGYGIIRLDKKSQKITMECWPRYANVKESSQQYIGWPKTISLTDNYARKAIGYLPPIECNMERPVVQVMKENTGEIVYTRRITEQPWRAPVFENLVYSILIGEPDEKMQLITGLKPNHSEKLIKVDLNNKRRVHKRSVMHQTP
jgi:alkaline phosphatase D